VLRSLLFHAAFYLATALFMIFGLPLLFGPSRWVLLAWKLHARTIILLLRIIARVGIEVRGCEHLPAGGCIIAAKHQSAWDTIAPMAYLRAPTVILKKELMSIPLYGQFARKMGMIPVRRDRGAPPNCRRPPAIRHRHLAELAQSRWQIRGGHPLFHGVVAFRVARFAVRSRGGPRAGAVKVHAHQDRHHDRGEDLVALRIAHQGSSVFSGSKGSVTN